MTPQELEKGIQFLKKAGQIVHGNIHAIGGGTDSFCTKYYPECKVVIENIEWFEPIIYSLISHLYIQEVGKDYLTLTIFGEKKV